MNPQALLGLCTFDGKVFGAVLKVPSINKQFELHNILRFSSVANIIMRFWCINTVVIQQKPFRIWSRCLKSIHFRSSSRLRIVDDLGDV